MAQCSSSATASSRFVHGMTPRPMRRSRETAQYSSPSQSLYARTAARYASSSVMVRQRRGPICMFGNSTSATKPSWSCSVMRCSGGPTPAVSATVMPNGCHVSLVRPARRSRKGTGRGSCPSTSKRIPAIGHRDRPRRLVPHTQQASDQSTAQEHFKCPSLEIKGGSKVMATQISFYHESSRSRARASPTPPRRAAGARRVQYARRRPKAAGEAYFPYVEPAAEGANEADGPSSAAAALQALVVDGEA